MGPGHGAGGVRPRPQQPAHPSWGGPCGAAVVRHGLAEEQPDVRLGLEEVQPGGRRLEVGATNADWIAVLLLRSVSGPRVACEMQPS